MDNSKRKINPDFVLNQPRYKGAQILLTRENFGCGSSREHAPWALEDYGFRVIIAPSYADIFFNNCFKNGLLPVRLDAAIVDALFKAEAKTEGFHLRVDLEKQTITTPDGTVTMDVPPGALPADTSITITENGPATRFTLQSSNVFSISARPENQRFDVPVTVTMRWSDRDNDGRVDRGECVGGIDKGLSCDANADCTSSACSLVSNLQETNLVLKRNSVKFSKNGFGAVAAPFDCDSHLSGACAAAIAECGDPTGTEQATVANCCDKTSNEWTFQTCSFSEFTMGEPAGGMVPGKGRTASDCVTEWVVDNPLNTPPSRYSHV
jgi:hypothetical protein